MNFYEEIAHGLYVWNTKIGETEFEPFDFIEAKHNEAPFKGKVFYQNLIKAMPNHFGAEMRRSFFNEVLQYCKDRIKALPPQQTETKTDKLKVKQIALIHVYEGLQITRENAGEIAAKYGYTAKNSGEGLFHDYTNYCSTANRKGKPTPCTRKRLMNKIELFESVVSHLSDNNKQRAIDEINILRTSFENEYQ